MIVEFLSDKRKIKRLAKGILSMTLSLIIGLSSLAIIPYVSPTSEAATQYTSGYYTYERLDSVHAKIVDVDSNISGSVAIPETLDGYTVSRIGSGAFWRSINITEIIVPNSVVAIEDYAFWGCSGLKSISLPNSLRYIYEYVFQNCSSLEKITVPDNVISIGDGAFHGCRSLKTVSLGSNVSVLGDYVFKNCSNLSSFSVSSSNTHLKVRSGALVNGNILVAYPPAKTTTDYTLPSNITFVERGAFSDCNKLKTVSVSNSVVEISYYAFDGCTNLTSVSLPSSVKKINNGAFYDCSSLKTINTSKVNYLGYSVFSGCSSLTSISLFSVNHWDSSVFSGCSSLTSVSLPNNVLEIPSSAFYGCSSLKTITIPSNIKSIGNRAFSGCTSLSSLSLPSGITNIGFYAFDKTDYYNNSSNWSSNGLLYNGNYLLSGKNATGDVSVKNGCVLIAGSAFNNNKNITSVTLPDSVKYICDSAFLNCINLSNIELGDNIISIGNSAFNSCSNLTTVKLGNNVSQIGEYAFAYSENLEEVVLPPSVTAIAYGTFQGCTGLKNVVISKNVKSIDSCAFRDCSPTTIFYDGEKSDRLKVSISSYQNVGLGSAYWEYSTTNKIIGFETEIEEKENSRGNVNVTFKSSWFEQDNTKYNHELARFCSDYVMMGYCEDKSKMINYLSEMGFDKFDANMSAARDEVNYFIASKKIFIEGEFKTLVFASFIGSYKEQWNSNFDPYGLEREQTYAKDVEKDKIHFGFADARDFAYSKLDMFIKGLNVDKSKIKLLISGHSRGAATANLLAAKIINTSYTGLVYKSNMYTYTFATPRVVNDSKAHSDTYKCIFNIVNPEDFVTKVLLADWGFVRYGVTYTLPSKTNESVSRYTVLKEGMQTYFYQFSGGDVYNSYPSGEKKVYNVINTMSKYLNGIEDFYEKEFVWAYGINPFSHDDDVMLSTFDYFKINILPFVNGNKEGQTFIGFLTDWATAHKVFKTLSNFFVIDQGLGVPMDKVDNVNDLDIADIIKVFVDSYFAESHEMFTYAAYMHSLTSSELTKYRAAHKNTVNCPVDIEVYDKSTNELVGKITNNIIDETVAAGKNAIVMDVDGDSKSFWLPSNGDYRVVLTGNDEGTMDYTVSNIDSDTGETIRANFFDVDIENDISMEGTFVSNKTTVESYTLTHEEMGTIRPTEILSENELHNYTVTTSAEGNGIADEEITVTSGDFTTVTASATEGGMFNGWYDNGNLVSTDIAYSFVVKEDKNLVAKFVNFAIKTPSITTINSGDSIILHADVADSLPVGAYIEWTADNSNFSCSVSDDGKTCSITPSKSGETTFTATVYDEDGNVIGLDTQTMTSKAGFFDKIIAFFKKLFGLTKVIPQAFKYNY